jgi:hypothetical protein
MTLIKKFSLAFLFLCFPILSWAGTTLELHTGNLTGYSYTIFKIVDTNTTSNSACYMDMSGSHPTPPGHLYIAATIGTLGSNETQFIGNLELNTNDEICIFAWKDIYACDPRIGCVSNSVKSAIVKVQDVLNQENNTITVQGQSSHLSFHTTSPSYTIKFSLTDKKEITVYQPFQNNKCYKSSLQPVTGAVFVDTVVTQDQENIPLFPVRNYEDQSNTNYSFCFRIEDGLAHQTHGPYFIDPATTPLGEVGTIEIKTTTASCFQPAGRDVCEPNLY